MAYAIPAGDGFVTDPAMIKSFANRKQCTTRYCTTGALPHTGRCKHMALALAPRRAHAARCAAQTAWRAPAAQPRSAARRGSPHSTNPPHGSPANLPLAPGIEDPNFFFQALLAKPYAQQVVWGPHFYGQSVIPYDLPKEYMQVGDATGMPGGLWSRPGLVPQALRCCTCLGS